MALVVNNLGGTSVLELNIVARAAITYLTQGKEVKVDRVYVGSLMTSLEMAGISITLLHLDKTRADCLDQSTTAPAWPRVSVSRNSGCMRTDKQPLEVPMDAVEDKNEAPSEKLTALGEKVYAVISHVTDALIAAEGKLNELDNLAGDGDCGTTLSRGASAIKKVLGSKDAPGLPCNQPEDLLLSLASLCEDHMGGSSGVFYSLFLMSGTVHLRGDSAAKSWARAWEAGVQAIMRYGGAEPGDRTMLDALHPAGSTLISELDSGVDPLEAVEKAVEAAEVGAQSTSAMSARAGRSSYVSDKHLNKPDPGALAVAVWFRAAFYALKN